MNRVQLQQVEAALEVSNEEDEKNNLISLRKDLRELINLTKETMSKSNSAGNSNATDSEFALFLSEMDKEGALAAKDVNKGNTCESDELKALEGSKCRAPHKHQWGDVVYHNAMICAVSSCSDERKEEDFEVGRLSHFL